MNLKNQQWPIFLQLLSPCLCVNKGKTTSHLKRELFTDFGGGDGERAGDV